MTRPQPKTLVRSLLYRTAGQGGHTMPMSSFKPFASILVCGALSAQVGGCGFAPLPEEGGTASVSEALAVSRATTANALDSRTAVASTKTVPAPEKIPAVLSAPTVIAPASPTPLPGASAASSTSDLESSHPWAVNISGTDQRDCRGMLIHPSWVLTAAHCIGMVTGTVSYSRTDPTTGAVSADSRSFDVYGRNQGMFVPDTYVSSKFGEDDIALIRLAKPFTIDRNIQTVGLPHSPANPGRTGAIATNSHGPALPSGYTAVVRAPQLAAPDCAVSSGFLCIKPPATSLCEGDSGSGFVMNLDGRATVVGITSRGSLLDPTNGCIGADGQADLTDVYAHRDWILGTMGMSLEEVAGRVRLRAEASSTDMPLRRATASSTGILSLRCLSTDSAAVEVSTNVPGGEIAIDCDDVQVFCQPPRGLNLTGFGLRTIGADGTTTAQALPYLSDFTVALVEPGSSFQQYTCTVGGGLLASTGVATAIMAF